MNRRSKARVTLQNVADDAEVSLSTASLVMNNNPRISEATRQRVRNSVQKLGYVYNQKAASLRTRRSHTIGMVITDITNPFYAELIQGVEIGLKQHGYAALLGSTYDNIDSQTDTLRTMRERAVDGIILVPADHTTAQEIEALKQEIPLVLVSRYVANVDVDYVGIDNELGARRAVEKLIEYGHRRIAFIGGSAQSSARRDRLQGFVSILEKYDIPLDPTLTRTSPVTRAGGFHAIQPLLNLPDPPTATLCYNDVVAFGVMLSLRQAGIEPGREFSVIGFDDVEEASLWSPSLTTIAADPARMGEEAASILLQRIQQTSDTRRQVIMPFTLMLRESINPYRHKS